jgi:hypothetical protein
MYKIETVPKSQMGKNSIFYNMAKFFNIPKELINKACYCEVWGTNFIDEGEDYCEFRFYSDSSTLIKTIRTKGY